jgi:FkbM family methyltransferase
MDLPGRVKLAIHALAARVGLKVSKVAPATDDGAALASMLAERRIDLVLDVGANVGQYALSLLDRGYGGRIVSFEPLAGPHNVLVAASRHHPGWVVAERCAIGEREGEIEIHISENSIASSPLAATSALLRSSPDARYVASERAPLHTLDGAAKRWLSESITPFLKIDVQGYEEQVLKGAAATLPLLAGIQIEMSLVRLYEGQMLMTEMLREIETSGFVLHRLMPSFIDVRDGRWLQADGLFFRE